MSSNLPPLPDLNRLSPFVEGLGKAILSEVMEDLAAIEADRVSRDVPAGWKLVPAEPTKEMLDAMVSSAWLPGCYRAMLAASHQPQPVQAQPSGWEPIETAPENMDRPAIVFWLNEEGEEQSCFDYTEDGCWMEWHNHAEHVEIIGGHGVSYTPPYTHWMPRPPRPTNQQKD